MTKSKWTTKRIIVVGIVLATIIGIAQLLL